MMLITFARGYCGRPCLLVGTCRYRLLRSDHWTVRRHWLRQLKQNADEGCNSCASLAGLVLSFIACFIVLFYL